MRIALSGLRVAGLIALFLPHSASAADSEPAAFQSGIYEGLMLAVSPDGVLDGFFREEQDEGVTKTCSFFLNGRAAGAAPVPIKTWNQQSFPGTLAPQPDGVQLAIPKGREHPGCSMVMLPTVVQGLALDLTRRTTWSGLEQIVTQRAYLRAIPEEQKSHTYVVHGDVVGVIGHSSHWLQVEYVNKKGGSTLGWILDTEATQLTLRMENIQR